LAGKVTVGLAENNGSLLLGGWLQVTCGMPAYTTGSAPGPTLNNEYYKNKNWLQFLFIVKAAVLKQQISKFYLQIQRTEASDYIYFSQQPVINVKAIFCA